MTAAPGRCTPVRLAVLVATLLAARAVSAAPVCTLIVDLATNESLVRSGDGCDIPNSPASTFKLALAVMGFDSGILTGAHDPAWPYKDEYDTPNEQWKKTVDPTIWLEESIVWFSQVITRSIGARTFQAYVDKMGYGNRDLSGQPGRNNGLTDAWLSSSLKISPSAQIAFLRRLLRRELPVSTSAIERTIAIAPPFQAAGGWTVFGKTGSGFQLRADGSRNTDQQFGWFIGWAQKGNRHVVFARLNQDDAPNPAPGGVRARNAFLAELPALLP
jgi:beta-lactamase class D